MRLWFVRNLRRQHPKAVFDCQPGCSTTCALLVIPLVESGFMIPRSINIDPKLASARRKQSQEANQFALFPERQSLWCGNPPPYFRNRRASWFALAKQKCFRGDFLYTASFTGETGDSFHHLCVAEEPFAACRGKRNSGDLSAILRGKPFIHSNPPEINRTQAMWWAPRIPSGLCGGSAVGLSLSHRS